jgi:branched-chain amino acid transport system substrate-binding protein
MSIKIGVLLPHSKENPSIGKDFVNGLKLALYEDEYRFIVAGIGLGNDQKLIVDTLQKFIHQEEVVITTGLLGHYAQNEITDFMENVGERMVYSDLGATRPNIRAKKGVYCNSFDLFQSVNHLANYFVEHSLNQVAMITSYYDCGYGFVESMGEVFEQSGTANFAGHFITPLVPRENEAQLMKDFVNYTNPQAIFGIYNGIYAKENAAYLAQNKINKLFPYYTTQFAVGEAILKENSAVFEGTKVISSWFPDLDNIENITFKKLYFEKYQNPVSEFSLLGYENGLIIKEMLKENKTDNPPIGPRGALRLHPETNRTSFPHFLSEIHIENDVITQKTLEVRGNEKSKIQIGAFEIEKSGWHNAYLCY